MTTRYVNSKLDIQNASRLIEDIQNANNTYYMFVGKPTPSSNDSIAEDLNLSTDNLSFGYYNDMIFGKKITDEDVVQMIERREWEANTIYDYYDHRTENLQDTDYYVTVTTNTNIEVFKCLWNGGGNTTSDIQPQASMTTAADQFFQTSDGYKWKWMYSEDSANSEIFVSPSSGYVPLRINANVVANAISGGIIQYVVEDGGQNYNSYTNGYFYEIAVSGNTLLFGIQSNSSANTDFYKGCAIKVISGTGAGQQRAISEYIVSGGSRRVLLDQEFDILPNEASIYEITPNVVVEGDGTGAIARAVMNVSSNSVHAVEVTSYGVNYTWANVTVYGNTGIISSNTVVEANAATVTAIISPPGGHGSNASSELFGKYVGIVTTFEGSETTTIPVVNDYHTIGIVKNPLFANVVLGIASLSGTFTNNEIILQQNTNASATAVVYTANALKITGASGTFSTGNDIFGVVVGQTSGATGQVANISINTMTKTFDTFDQRTRMGITILNAGTFVEDESIVQNSTRSQAYIHEANSSFLGLTNVKGNLTVSDITTQYPITGETSGTSANVTSLIQPDLTKYSGDLIYIENIIPIERDASQDETIRLAFKL